MESHTPPSVLVNQNDEVVHFSSNAAEYVRIPGGLTHDVTRLVVDPLRPPLAEGLRAVRAGRKRWESAPLRVSANHGPRHLILHVEEVPTSGLLLVVFDELNPKHVDPAVHEDASKTIAGLEVEVKGLSRRLQTALDQSGAEQDAPLMYSQLQDANTELQSVLEELATSREELQGIKEELIALDDENRRRVYELTQVSTDLQHLLTSTGIATLFLDDQLKLVRFTPLLGELFGLRLADVGRPVADLAGLRQYESFEADAREVLQRQEPVEHEVAGAGGRWYLSRLLPYRTEGGLVEGVVLTLIDITERKRAELALQNSNRNKDHFLAVLAHELRNPLAPISAGIEVLKAAPADLRTVERMAATMGRQTKQLVRLIEDLLEVSRISGGKLRLRTAILDLREVVKDAVNGARSAIDAAGHTLEVRMPGEPMPVNGDSARLVQVLSNLLNNAVRYTPRSGLIRLSVERRDDDVTVAVKDTGVGIPPEAIENIFDMFYQGLHAHPERGAGLGIGLTLAKTLVEMHGGSITANSGGDQQGSEFKVQLPLASASELPRQGSPDEGPLALETEHRILIVDDNVDAAETLCTLMKSLGEREVYTASSGAQALQRAPQLHPDIVLLDLMMPEMDGYEVARRIRSQPWGKQLLLVALSGWGHEEHRRRTKAAGFDRHVTKPADLAVLRAVLRESRVAH